MEMEGIEEYLQREVRNGLGQDQRAKKEES